MKEGRIICKFLFAFSNKTIELIGRFMEISSEDLRNLDVVNFNPDLISTIFLMVMLEALVN